MTHYQLSRANGFTLVELMIVMAIAAILSSVAIPAYVNHVNRVKQSEAVTQLLTARIEMEEFLADNGRYATTISCLPTFRASTSATCTDTSYKSKYYSFSVSNVNGGVYYKVAATRKVYSYAPDDSLYVSAGTDTPQVLNESALKFSVFKWLFQ